MAKPTPLHDALRLVYVCDLEGVADWQRLDALLAAGTTAIWLRAPGASGADLFRATRSLLQRTAPHGAAVIVGDRADVALAAGAHGVQLGFRSPPASRVRSWFPGWIGVSCHNENELAAAQRAQADFAVLSPVYGVPEKGSPLGEVLFRQLRGAVTLPVVALGGLEPDNVDVAWRAGADGVAAIRALRDASDPAEAARAFRSAEAERSSHAPGS